MTTTAIEDGPAPEVEAPSPIAPFTAHDRCDVCSAQAYVGVLLTEDNTAALLWCGHHAARDLPIVETMNPHAIRDDRHLLTGENRLVGSEN